MSQAVNLEKINPIKRYVVREVSEVERIDPAQATNTKTSFLARVGGFLFRKTRKVEVEDVSISAESKFHNVISPELDFQVSERNRFHLAVSRIRKSPQYSTPEKGKNLPYGFFGSRHIISETSQVDGGIYFGPVPHEAIVLDKKYGLLSCIESELLSRLSVSKSANNGVEHSIIQEVIAITKATINYDPENTKALLNRENIRADDKVALDLFITERVGVSRHQVLLFAYLVESLKINMILEGSLFFDSRMINEGIEDERVIYSGKAGNLFIFDPGFEYRKANHSNL